MTLVAETQAIALSESNIQGTLPVSNSKRSIRDVNGEDNPVSKVQIVCPDASDGEIENEDEVEEKGDDDEDDVFFKALKEFEGKDIDALKAFIASSE
jgi:hypothetical protein